MSDAGPSAMPKATMRRQGDDRLFLTGQKLREGAELMFFAYRAFTSDPDRILNERGYGRAHHRALHFIGRSPGISVAGLLDLLAITKQSLARVLRPLVEDGFVDSVPGERDRRQRLLTLTDKGRDFEGALAEAQRERLSRAFRAAGPEAVAGFREVMALMIDERERDGILRMVYDTPDGAS